MLFYGTSLFKRRKLFLENMLIDKSDDIERCILGFSEEIIRPEFAHFPLFIDSFEITIDDYLRMDGRVISQCLEDFEAIHLWHHNIEDHDRRLELYHFRDTDESIRGFFYDISFTLKCDFIHLENIVIILDDQDFFSSLI